MRRFWLSAACALAGLATVPATAKSLPPLACEASDGSWMLGLYGPVAQLRSPELTEFVTSQLATGPDGWPAYQALASEAATRVARVDEAACETNGGSFPLRLELFDPTTGTLTTGCCTVAE
ncbi:hypothetical protein [Pseudoruegeria sp. SHC-113]|uniref:hypothetical protein n=1 Tax=Pseudoruegeria sp. SHC-113 TaxID=2855439 RepID=UPI0021BBA8A0|nr:hypothetical protein [Pseudoruegeria sp. SHC-113]MCT8160410.1 hypothetical protein [Pseudoruegeria sp. SHC-113]